MEVVAVSPSSTLVIRPRPYEVIIANMDPDLGPVPRPVIEAALAECGVETLTGTAFAAIDNPDFVIVP